MWGGDAWGSAPWGSLTEDEVAALDRRPIRLWGAVRASAALVGAVASPVALTGAVSSAVVLPTVGVEMPLE